MHTHTGVPPRHGFSSKKLDVLGIHLWIQIKNSRCFLTESLCKDLLDALGQPFFKKNKKRIILFLLNSHQKLHTLPSLCSLYGDRILPSSWVPRGFREKQLQARGGDPRILWEEVGLVAVCCDTSVSSG